MVAWYSGLLPYPILLPLQIAILMLMTGLTIRASDGRSIGRGIAGGIRAFALIYFLTMAARLVLCIRDYGRDYHLHGAIPVAFHWVLALFVLVYSRVAARVQHRARRD
jgi:hypothetical protein